MTAVLGLLAVPALVGGIGYSAYVGAVASETFVRPSGNTDLRTLA